MTVASIMKVKGHDVVTASATESMADITRKLEKHGIGALVIVNPASEVQGIISERDIVRALARKGAPALDQKVSAYMTKNVITCSELDLIDTVMEKMSAGKFRHMPVVSDGKLAGIVSIGDVVKHRIAQAEHEAEALREYVTMT